MNREISLGGNIVGGTVSLLKAIRRNSVLFGVFLILQGLILTATLGGGFYNVLAVFGMLMTLVVVSEIVLRIFHQKKTVWNVLLCGLLCFAIFCVIVVLIAMIANPLIRARVFLLTASVTAIYNGIINIIASVKLEPNKWLRFAIITASVLCIGFGLSYWMTYENAPSLLIRSRGIILMLIGAIDIWLGLRAGQSVTDKRLP